MLEKGNLFSIHVDGMTPAYAQVINIEPDVKDDWWVLTYRHFYTYPAKEQTLLLRTAYLAGEVFSLQGNDTRLVEEGVVSVSTQKITPISELETLPDNVFDFVKEKEERR